MSWKNRLWKYATALVVVLLFLNPEMAQLALFIDAAGLELFLLLIEIQVIGFLGALFGTRVTPLFGKRQVSLRTYLRSMRRAIADRTDTAMIAAPGAGALMCLLVISVGLSNVVILYA